MAEELVQTHFIQMRSRSADLAYGRNHDLVVGRRSGRDRAAWTTSPSASELERRRSATNIADLHES
jgi:hypothetical protein